MSFVDNETDVIAKCVQFIEGLDHQACRRCVLYLADRYHVLVEKCSAKKPEGPYSRAAECYLLAGHEGPHEAPGVAWHDHDDDRD